MSMTCLAPGATGLPRLGQERRQPLGRIAGCAVVAMMLAMTVAEAAPRHGVAPNATRQAAPWGQSNAQGQTGPRGEVLLNGRWVSSSWCDATLPGADGGPAGPGRSLCNASTPRR